MLSTPSSTGSRSHGRQRTGPLPDALAYVFHSTFVLLKDRIEAVTGLLSSAASSDALSLYSSLVRTYVFYDHNNTPHKAGCQR